MMDGLREINPFVRGHAHLCLPLPLTPLKEYVNREMGLATPDMTGGIRAYERANLEVMEDWRPWCNEDEVRILQAEHDAFNLKYSYDSYKPYVLDRVLAGEEIDLVSSLSRLQEIGIE